MQFHDKVQPPLLSHNQESWVCANMMNDYVTEAANSRVYLCIYLQQK